MCIREQDPLKQGLKHYSKSGYKSRYGIREQDPLKQGLKHPIFLRYRPVFSIREQDPLKQGLKLLHISRIIPQYILFVSKIH